MLVNTLVCCPKQNQAFRDLPISNPQNNANMLRLPSLSLSIALIAAHVACNINLKLL